MRKEKAYNTNNVIRKPYSPSKSLVPPTMLVRIRCKVRVCGSGLGLGFWNLVGSGRNKRFSGRIIGTDNVIDESNLY